jgi:L-asparaginase II
MCVYDGRVAGYQMGSSAEMCMKRIVEAMQREGYVVEGKRRIIK